MNAPDWIIWDWNGTLLDDNEATLSAFNEQLVKRGYGPVTFDFYRRNFSFPVKPFYALCGVDLAREDWDAIAREYHEAYAHAPKTLNREAISALRRARALGARQGILSALRQDLLDAAVDAAGIRPFFDFVCGSDNLDGSGKMERAKDLKAHLSGRLVMIGDALHDYEVARAMGARCVLCAQGGHSAERLKAVAPTGDTLLEAIALAIGA